MPNTIENQQPSVKRSRLLERQLRKSFGPEFTSTPEMETFLGIVQQSYNDYEESVKMISHSMEVSSQELVGINQDLLLQKKQLESAYEVLRSTQNQLEESERMLQLSSQLQRAYERLNAAQRHASRLQKALLGNKDDFAQLFEQSFIYFNPLDMVSGDFYWFSEKEDYGTRYKFIVLADCTGHGVPAAFMTVLGVNFLNQIVNDRHIHEPERIMFELNRRLTHILKSGSTDDFTLTDGMDVSVVAIDQTDQRVYFSGARQSLWYVRNWEITEIKGDVVILGDTRKSKSKKFTQHMIEYQEGDTFYLSSDGFFDQFDAKDHAKYMKKNFKDLLLSISHFPMEKQQHLLTQEHINWKQDTKQTDDILVVGFKL